MRHPMKGVRGSDKESSGLPSYVSLPRVTHIHVPKDSIGRLFL